MADEEDAEYEIREVLNERRRGKVIEYLIDWKPSGSQTWDPTWEPAENVSETALAYYKEQKKKNATKKKKGGVKKRKTPAKSTKKKKDAKDKAADDSNAMEDDDAENSAVNGDSADKPSAAASESEPKSKRQKRTPTTNVSLKASRKVGGETTEEAKVPTSDVDSTASRYKHLDDDDDANLYPKKIVHFVPQLCDIPLSSSGLQSDSRLASLKHYYGEEATNRLARVLRHSPELEITDEVFESMTGLPMSDLLLRGVFAIDRGVPNRYVKRLRTCTTQILSMIERKFSTSHRLAGDCKNIYEASSVELAEVQKRGTTLDFSLNWWREHYPVLNRVAYHAQWYRTVIKALGHFFNCKMKCEWIGLLHSPPGSRGQVVHRDGRSKRHTTKPSSSSSNAASAEESKASNESAVEMFMSPRNPGVPRVPSSITVCVPLCDIKAIAEDAMSDDADLPEGNDDRRHNGATEFFLSSHMSEFLAKDSESSSSSSPSPRYVTLKGPFPKTVVSARAGACFGWGFDFAHNGGPNASKEARQMMYFVYHVPGSAQDDENIKQFKDAKAAGSTLFMGNYSTKDDFIP